MVFGRLMSNCKVRVDFFFFGRDWFGFSVGWGFWGFEGLFLCVGLGRFGGRCFGFRLER